MRSSADYPQRFPGRERGTGDAGNGNLRALRAGPGRHHSSTHPPLVLSALARTVCAQSLLSRPRESAEHLALVAILHAMNACGQFQAEPESLVEIIKGLVRDLDVGHRWPMACFTSSHSWREAAPESTRARRASSSSRCSGGMPMGSTWARKSSQMASMTWSFSFKVRRLISATLMAAWKSRGIVSPMDFSCRRVRHGRPFKHAGCRPFSGNTHPAVSEP